MNYENLLKSIYKRMEIDQLDHELYQDAFDAILQYTDESQTPQVKLSHELMSKLGPAMKLATGMRAHTFLERGFELYRNCLFYGAPYCLDDFARAIEVDRKPEKKFYEPRRHYLRPMIQGYQDLLDGKIRLLTVSQPKRTGKSQTEILFTLMLSGRYPDKSTLMEGTGDDLVRSFYNGCLEYLDTQSEYCYYQIFPQAKVIQTNADLKTINLNTRNRFPTIMCRSIDSRQVGLSEATNALVLDDCVEGREEAKNRQRLEDKWEIISGDIMGRAIEGTPMVFTGTRYSIYDPIGKIQDYADKQHWPWRAIEIPALDPITGESNYEHERDGKKVFTTAYFQEQRELLSEEQFESEFQQQPFEPKGVLFPKKDLNYYFELPPDREPDAIVAACDTAESGSDSVSMPIAYLYGGDVFIHDVVFDNSLPKVTKIECAKALYQHHVVSATFESNNAGEYFARDVARFCENLKAPVSIRIKRTISNKQTRIEMASDTIIRTFYFRDPSTYERGSQYFNFMKELTSYTRTGKVPHDDAPDSLAMLENELRTRLMPAVEVFSRPV